MQATKERAAAKKAAPAVLTLGAAADKIWALREDKRALDKQVTAIEAEIAALTETIIGMLDAADSRKAEGKKASISVNTSVQANPTDWTEFMRFVAKGKRNDKDAYLHLVQKRVAVEAYRELLELKIEVPGVTPFNKRTLSITAL